MASHAEAFLCCEACGLPVEDGSPGPVCRRCLADPGRAMEQVVTRLREALEPLIHALGWAMEQADLALASFVARLRAALQPLIHAMYLGLEGFHKAFCEYVHRRHHDRAT